MAFGLGQRSPASARRRAAVLGAVTGIAWGFVAAVIKEFSSRLGQGPGPILGSWSLYVLIGAGAASLLLASHALAAGPLAASQPGFTILDPLTAGLLGLFLFGEHIQTAPLNLTAEALALTLLAGGASTLSHSHLPAADNTRPVDAANEQRDLSATPPTLFDANLDLSATPSTASGTHDDRVGRQAALLRDASQAQQGGDAGGGEDDDRERGAPDR
jgi:hypothetical protein